MSLKVEEDDGRTDGRTARRDEMRAIESERERGGPDFARSTLLVQ